MSQVDSYLIMGIVFVILFFLAMRELVCWYWKINELVGLLKSIDHTMKKGSPSVQEEAE